MFLGCWILENSYCRDLRVGFLISVFVLGLVEDLVNSKYLYL